MSRREACGGGTEAADGPGRSVLPVDYLNAPRWWAVHQGGRWLLCCALSRVRRRAGKGLVPVAAGAVSFLAAASGSEFADRARRAATRPSTSPSFVRWSDAAMFAPIGPRDGSGRGHRRAGEPSWCRAVKNSLSLADPEHRGAPPFARASPLYE